MGFAELRGFRTVSNLASPGEDTARRGDSHGGLLVQEGMALSARNQLPGTIKEIQIGDIMAHVVVKVDKHLVESVITRGSALELGLKKGDAVKVVVKSTEVMIQKD